MLACCRYANETWTIVGDDGKDVVKRFKIDQVPPPRAAAPAPAIAADADAEPKPLQVNQWVVVPPAVKK
jgi:hypothetical protein